MIMVSAYGAFQAVAFFNRLFAGGMDAYVRAFGLNMHDEFYSNERIINAFKNYTTHVVSRYANSSAIFGWELANDPRFVVFCAYHMYC